MLNWPMVYCDNCDNTDYFLLLCQWKLFQVDSWSNLSGEMKEKNIETINVTFN